jgi:uncharacterized protein
MLANKFVKDPREVVKAGDVVKVKVLEVDLPRKRIALTMRLADEIPVAEKSSGAPVSAKARHREAQQPAAAGAMASAFARLKH